MNYQQALEMFKQHGKADPNARNQLLKGLTVISNFCENTWCFCEQEQIHVACMEFGGHITLARVIEKMTFEDVLILTENCWQIDERGFFCHHLQNGYY